MSAHRSNEIIENAIRQLIDEAGSLDDTTLSIFARNPPLSGCGFTLHAEYVRRLEQEIQLRIFERTRK